MTDPLLLNYKLLSELCSLLSTSPCLMFHHGHVKAFIFLSPCSQCLSCLHLWFKPLEERLSMNRHPVSICWMDKILLFRETACVMQPSLCATKLAHPVQEQVWISLWPFGIAHKQENTAARESSILMWRMLRNPVGHFRSVSCCYYAHKNNTKVNNTKDVWRSPRKSY